MPDLINIYHNNQQEGPYSHDQLREMIANGTVTPITLAWQEGMSEWAPLNTIISLPPTTPAAVPPPPTRGDRESFVPPSPIAAKTGPKGINGWLVFFCVGLTILSPLISLAQIRLSWEQVQPLFEQFPNFKTAFMWENIGSVALLIYGFIVGVIVWGGNTNGREIAKRYLLIRLFGFIGIELITILIMSTMTSQIVMSAIAGVFGATMRETVYFLIWWFYFKKSKRVRNTYGEI